MVQNYLGRSIKSLPNNSRYKRTIASLVWIILNISFHIYTWVYQHWLTRWNENTKTWQIKTWAYNACTRSWSHSMGSHITSWHTNTQPDANLGRFNHSNPVVSDSFWLFLDFCSITCIDWLYPPIQGIKYLQNLANKQTTRF